MDAQLTLQQIINTMPQVGKVEWIGIRPARKMPLQTVEEVAVDEKHGLEGDHYSKSDGNRQVTLIQAEHLEVVAAFLGVEKIDPSLTRRNVLVSGINLLAFKDRRFQIGTLILEMTGICHPCSRMEETLGAGAYNALRGHSGITAKVIKGGLLRVGDRVALRLEQDA